MSSVLPQSGCPSRMGTLPICRQDILRETTVGTGVQIQSVSHFSFPVVLGYQKNRFHCACTPHLGSRTCFCRTGSPQGTEIFSSFQGLPLKGVVCPPPTLVLNAGVPRVLPRMGLDSKRGGSPDLPGFPTGRVHHRPADADPQQGEGPRPQAPRRGGPHLGRGRCGPGDATGRGGFSRQFFLRN